MRMGLQAESTAQIVDGSDSRKAGAATQQQGAALASLIVPLLVRQSEGNTKGWLAVCMPWHCSEVCEIGTDCRLHRR